MCHRALGALASSVSLIAATGLGACGGSVVASPSTDQITQDPKTNPDNSVSSDTTTGSSYVMPTGGSSYVTPTGGAGSEPMDVPPSSGGGGGGGGGAGGGGGVEMTTCPTQLPALGSRCALGQQPCVYRQGACSNLIPQTVVPFHCNNGVWGVSGSFSELCPEAVAFCQNPYCDRDASISLWQGCDYPCVGGVATHRYCFEGTIWASYTTSCAVEAGPGVAIEAGPVGVIEGGSIGITDAAIPWDHFDDSPDAGL
jgi:hypothetical protein